MADPRFFTRAGPFTAAALAARTGTALGGADDPERLLIDVAPLESAEPSQVSFLDNPKYLAALRATRAGAVILQADRAATAPPGIVLLLSPAPYRAYALAAQAFYPIAPPVPGIAPSAFVDATARLGPGCAVEPHAVIGAHAELGARCVVAANATIGAGCIIGDDTRIGANASISHAFIGQRVLIYPGARIGQDGFGFALDPRGHVKVPQLGRVIIGDDVEVGANSAIDRGAGPDTVIGAGTMIDNLVQIGHNVQIGPGCVLVAQTGVAGSAKLGDFVMVGGQVAITGHLVIGSGSRIGGQSGVARNVAPGETVMGSPAVPILQHHRQVALLHRLVKRRGGRDGSE